MAKLDGDFDIDVKRHYRVEAGQDDDYGKVNYRVLTNNGSGFGFYEDKPDAENFQMAVSHRSFESCGEMVERPRDAAQDKAYPAKWIDAKHGDIVLECQDGDIYLKAHNIFMEANGVKDTMDGDIQMKANQSVTIDSPDIRVTGSNLRLTARYSFTISAKVVGGIVAGVLNMASSADFGASIPLSKLTQLKEALEAE